MVASSRQIKRVLVRRRTSAPKTHPRGDLLPAAVDVRDLQDAYQAGVEDGQPRGWSGTAVAGGYIEGVEPNTDLRNRAWRGYTNSPGIGEQMYLTDGAVAASANEWIERAQNADWRIDPGDTDDPDGQMHAEFARRNLFELSATSWLSNARNFAKAIMWGCALAETIFARDSKDEAPTFQKVEGRRLARWEETGQFDRDHYILTDLAPRLPTSIEEWRQDTETGSFDGIVQTSPLDNTARSGSFGEVFIGAEHLVLVTYGGDGNNWEGFSRFRSVYIPWKARQTLLRMGVIAAERFGVGVPIAKQTEDGWADRAGAKAAWAEVKRQVARYRGGAQAWMALPFGVDVEVQEPALPAAQHVLALYNQMAMDIHIAGETQHLIQGTQQVGTYGLREGQSSEFKATINPFLRAIARAVNKSVIKPLIDLNWLGVKRYPELTFGDQQHGSTKEDMEAYQIGVTSGAVTPQIEDEEFFRSRFQWPEMTEESEEARTNEPAAVEPEPVIEPPEDEEPEVVAGACGCGCSEMFGTVPFEDEPSDGSPAADVRLLAESKFDANTSRMSRVEAVERTSIRLAAQVQTLVLTPYLKKIEPALESGDAAAIVGGAACVVEEGLGRGMHVAPAEEAEAELLEVAGVGAHVGLDGAAVRPAVVPLRQKRVVGVPEDVGVRAVRAAVPAAARAVRVGQPEAWVLRGQGGHDVALVLASQSRLVGVDFRQHPPARLRRAEAHPEHVASGAASAIAVPEAVHGVCRRSILVLEDSP